MLGIIGSLVALFGVVSYFADRRETREVEARKQSLAYVERWGSTEFRAQRKVLFDFWLAHADVTALINSDGASDRTYQSVLMTALEAYSKRKETMEALFTISDFFDQANFCMDSGVCQKPLLQSYLCASAKDFTRTYSPLTAAISQTADTSKFGRGAAGIASKCAS